MMIPILVKHDHSRAPLGYIEAHNNELRAVFVPPVTREHMFAMLGNVGVRVLESRYPATAEGLGPEQISRVQIIEFSVQDVLAHAIELEKAAKP